MCLLADRNQSRMLAVVVPREDFLARLEIAATTIAATTGAGGVADAAAAAATSTTVATTTTIYNNTNGHDPMTITTSTQRRLDYLCTQKGANEAVLASMVAVAHAASRPPHEG